MTQEPQQTHLVPAAKPPSDLTESNSDGRDASLINLPPISVSTTFLEGAPLYEQRAFNALQASAWRPPVAGVLSVIFAIVAFYHTTLLMAPLAILAGLVALCRKQYNWAAIGIIAGLVALVSDVTFWALLGVTWTMHWLFWS
jgi:hypothetical protein